MDDKSKENPKKYQNIITQKLRELLGEYEVDILTEYIWHMARNAQSSAFMVGELQDFLGDHTEVFVTWLTKLMSDMKKKKKNEEEEDEEGDAEETKDNISKEENLKNKSDISQRDKKYRDLRLKPSGFEKDGGNRKEFSTGRKHARSFLSRSRSSSNEKSSITRRKMRKRMRENRSNERMSDNSSPARKFQYRSRSKTRRRERSRSRDKNRSRDRMRSKDKYRRSERRNSTSQGRIIYVDKGDDSKEKRVERNSYSGTFIDKNDIEVEQKFDNNEEGLLGEKKKVILKPNPRFARESPMHLIQPIIPPSAKVNASAFNMGNNYGFDPIVNSSYEGPLIPASNFQTESYGIPPQRPLGDNFANPSLHGQRYPQNFHAKPYRSKHNIQRGGIGIGVGVGPGPGPVNYTNPNRFPATTTAVNYPNANNPTTNVVMPNIGGMHNVVHQNNKMNFNTPNTMNLNRGPQNYIESQSGTTAFNYNATQSNVPLHSFQPTGNLYGDGTKRIMQGNFQGITNVNNAPVDKGKLPTKEKEITNEEETGVEGEVICNEQALTQTGMASSDGVKNTNVIIKIQKKCMFLPNCQYGDKCRYIHPTENCRNWPYCAYGKDCIYIHPEVPCKFGAFCCNYYCNYSHKHVDSSLPVVAELGSTGYFLNKKLVNNVTDQVVGKNFDDKVAQISISMPKTPPEMRRDKSRGEYNENEYIQSMLEEERRFTENANDDVGKHMDNQMNRNMNLHEGNLKDELDIMNDCNMNQEEREKERMVLSNPNYYCTETNDIEVKLDGFNKGNAISYNGSNISINNRNPTMNKSGINNREGLDKCFEIVEDPVKSCNINNSTYNDGGNQTMHSINNNSEQNNTTQDNIDTNKINNDNNNNNNAY